MTRAQRLILAIGLLLLAAITHAHFCDWSFGGESRSRLLVGRTWETIETTTYATPQSDGTPGTGITRRARTHTWGITQGAGYGAGAEAFAWGIVAPSIMILVALTFLTGWRQSVRRERGQCLRCGYDLKFKYEAGCPECGWRRP